MKSQKFFTLVELLVVIAIIMILSSILMPSLIRVKEKSRSILCQNNQRQLASTIFAYTGDYNGYLIPLYESKTWTTELHDNYLSNNWNVFKCPSAPADWTVFSNWQTHYGYNYFMNNADHFKDWVKIEKINSPSRVIMTLDTTQARSNPVNGYYTASYDYYHIRHGQGLNISYSDTHVNYVSKIPPNQPAYADSYSGHPFFWKYWRNIW